MKKSKVKISFVLLLGIIVGACIGVTADTVIKDVKVQINSSIKYKLNGNDFVPKNADGSVMDTLMYNGRSYVPLRAVADALKVAVDWDGVTSTIILGKREGKGVSLLDLKPQLGTNQNASNYFIASTVDKDNLTFKGESDVVFSFGINSQSSRDDSCYIYFNTGKKFQTLKFTTWTTDSDGRMIIYDNTTRTELKRFDVAKNELKEIEVDIGGIEKIDISFGGYNNTRFVIAEPYLN